MSELKKIGHYLVLGSVSPLVILQLVPLYETKYISYGVLNALFLYSVVMVWVAMVVLMFYLVAWLVRMIRLRSFKVGRGILFFAVLHSAVLLSFLKWFPIRYG